MVILASTSSGRYNNQLIHWPSSHVVFGLHTACNDLQASRNTTGTTSEFVCLHATFPTPTSATTSVGCVQPVHRPFPTRPTLGINNIYLTIVKHSWVYTTGVYLITNSRTTCIMLYMQCTWCTHTIWSENLQHMLSTGALFYKCLHMYSYMLIYTALYMYIIYQCGLQRSITITAITSSTLVVLWYVDIYIVYIQMYTAYCMELQLLQTCWSNEMTLYVHMYVQLYPGRGATSDFQLNKYTIRGSQSLQNLVATF